MSQKLEEIKQQVMINIAMANITDYEKAYNMALEAGLNEADAAGIAAAVIQYEESNAFDARELSKVDFRKYGNDLLIVSGIDNITKALIAKAGFKIRPDDNSMIVYCYLDHTYGIEFELIAPAKMLENGEVEIGSRNPEITLKFGLDSFAGRVEAYPGGAKVAKDVVEKIKTIINEHDISDSIHSIRLIEGLDWLRVPGYPDDMVVCFMKKDQEPEGIVCRIEDADKDNKRLKMTILQEPAGSYDKHIGDVIDAVINITEFGQYRIYSYFDNRDNENENDKTRILDVTDFLVRTAKYQCTFKTHKLYKLNAIVRVMDTSSKLITEIEVPSYYCSKCDRYYILESDYRDIQKNGYICCRVDSYESLANPDYGYFGKLNEKSILMNYGYNVDKRKELTEKERHEILSFMIDNNIIKKSKAIEYINWFITISKNHSNRQDAITKWKKDIAYLQEYTKSETSDYSRSIKKSVKRIKLIGHKDYVQSTIDDYL